MNSIFFNIYNYMIKIESSEFDPAQLKINLDFNYFSTKPDTNCHLCIRINKLSSFKKKGFFFGKTFMCEVRQVSYNERQLIYRDNSAVLAVVKDVTSPTARQVDILALNQQITDDILYFLIHSCVGEHLDRSGLVRIHALSYSFKNKNGIVYGRSGSGKSTLALGLLNYNSVKIYSDEITIFDIKNKILLPYPIRISIADFEPSSKTDSKFTYFFNKKKLVEIKKDKISSKNPLTNFYCIDDVENKKIFYLLNIVMGFGLIQMWEYLLRFNNFKTLLNILVNRIRLCLILNDFSFVILKKQASFDEKTKTLL